MALFLTLLPVYLFGNLHCIGMCGPLVMMIGQHRFRYLYFLGRAVAFTLAGLIAGGLGSVLGVTWHEYYLGALLSLFFGTLILCIGFSYVFNVNIPYSQRVATILAPLNKQISLLMLSDRPSAVFYFGFLTIFLPCGQTMIVFSACAVYGSALAGFSNGLIFALFTTPALYISMQAHKLFSRAKQYYHLLFGVASLVVGVLTMLRGLADLDVISHFILNPLSASEYHLVLF